MRLRAVVPFVSLALGLAACGSGAADQPSTATTQTTALHSTGTQSTGTESTPTVARTPRRVTKLLVVLEENHGARSALAGMRYLRLEARIYGRAARYFALSHPSLPNYLSIAGGSTFGIQDDNNPQAHHLRGRSVFGQVLASRRRAVTYAESMTRRCQQFNAGPYAVRHNPWTYFVSAGERRGCLRHDIPAGSTARGPLHNAVRSGRLPAFGLLVPNVLHDAHSASLASADTWLRHWLIQIKRGPDYRAGRLAILVTFDEDGNHSSANQVLTVLITPSVRHVVVRRRLSHLALSATVSRLVHRAPLRKAHRRPDILRAFGVPH
ncbi:MAG: alkaline phosphatase family protein [Nocardioidaceae bacterium]